MKEEKKLKKEKKKMCLRLRHRLTIVGVHREYRGYWGIMKGYVFSKTWLY